MNSTSSRTSYLDTRPFEFACAATNLFSFLFGASLWIPGFAVHNFFAAWGLQFAVCAAIGAGGAALFAPISRYAAPDTLRLAALSTLAMIAWLCTMILVSVGSDRVAFERSATALAGHGVAVVVAISMSLSWLLSPKSFSRFVQGFCVSGSISCLYALYQLAALRLALPFGYLQVNNESFVNLTSDVAAFHGRAMAATPEPSVLASLALILASIGLARFSVARRMRDFFLSVIGFLGLGATTSQVLALVPFVAILALLVVKHTTGHLRGIAGPIVLSLAILCSGAVYFLDDVLAERVVNSLDPDAPEAARVRDFVIAAQVLLNAPSGEGVGALSSVADEYSWYNEMGASSAAVRIAIELGLPGLTCCLIALLFWGRAVHLAHRVRNKLSFDKQRQCIDALVFAMVTFLAGASFVGYRNLYHLIVFIPLCSVVIQKIKHTSRVIEA